MASSEAVPFAKTGGLADVVGALPKALAAHGVEAAVVLPRYRQISTQGLQRVYENLPVRVAGRSYPASVFATRVNGVQYYLADIPSFFDRIGLYAENKRDYWDNHVRFAAYCAAVLSVARHIFRPDVLHVHDWQAALVPPYLKLHHAYDPAFLGIKTLLTIHNLAYQGRFGKRVLGEVGIDYSLFRSDLFEFHGDVNLLKGGICYADAISTVSKKYSEEIQTPEFGEGLEGLIRARNNVLHGIVNGVDYSEWDPQTDPHIAANYSIADLSGKRICKQDLLREFGLPDHRIDSPLVGIVSRFAKQKGFDLIAWVIRELLERDLTFVVLGTGDAEYESMFRHFAWQHPEKVAVRIAYDNVIAHKIEAGADLFLMPSRYEPCGLNQIYSLRYGTAPIVRATGGLEDTITGETGFKFWEYHGQRMVGAVDAALAAWRDPDAWRARVIRCMEQDFSWDRSAGAYAALYARLLT